MIKSLRPTSVPANPEQWSEKSKQSVAFGFRLEYKDKPYNCWHCHADSVFTAQDQKYTFEILRASITQNRILCQPCWTESNRIRASLRDCEEQWSLSKRQLQADETFLGRWLDLLVALEKYVPYKPDTAKKNMLSRLLSKV
ncbi:zinc-ribbon domain containing protein [Pseudoduganella violaceinigra]|uniref:zinc-ribbon domain containing protein n=1 Tax=Pseudoduganella violaceinigra TaxID=246602 RepID=UPI000A011060|nr:zinc-ribbon domain containing protein [Pseudoduganella violaceinigra]